MRRSFEKAEEVSNLLDKKYHSPRLGNKKNPLNELLYIQLSLRTTGPSFERVYTNFKKVFPRWNKAYYASKRQIASAIFNAGLSNQKATNLKAVLKKLKADFGKITMSPLRKLSHRELEGYLCSLPGVGKKAARCIMLYSFDKMVFPVDSHCFRIIKRLGWIHHDARYSDKIADKIQEMIPLKLRYSLHVNMVAHGRSVCLERYPKCFDCPLLQLCPFGLKTVHD